MGPAGADQLQPGPVAAAQWQVVFLSFLPADCQLLVNLPAESVHSRRIDTLSRGTERQDTEGRPVVGGQLPVGGRLGGDLVEPARSHD
jgi:hypothetical protein